MWLKIKYITLEETGEKEQMQRIDLEKNKVQYNKNGAEKRKKHDGFRDKWVNGNASHFNYNHI